MHCCDNGCAPIQNLIVKTVFVLMVLVASRILKHHPLGAPAEEFQA